MVLRFWEGENLFIKNYLCFIGISNWVLDAAKKIRGFTLSVPELHEKYQFIFHIFKSMNLFIFEKTILNQSN